MNSAKHTELISVLKEWGMKEDNIGFREAVIALRNYLSVKPNDKADKCLFGDIALCATDYNFYTAAELEAMRKYLAVCKKHFKGMKFNVRILADTGFKKELIAIAEPGRVMWELSGIDMPSAEAVAAEVSKMADIKIQAK